MSVTFRIEGVEEDRGFDIPCPDCGFSMVEADQGAPAPQSCSCFGYGGPKELPEVHFELNVANTNARAILDLLDISAEELIGSIDAEELLFRLSMYADRAYQYAKEPTRNGNYIDCGRSMAQVENYIDRLVKIARKAEKRGKKVIFG